MRKHTILIIAILLSVSANAFAASQLAPLFETLKHVDYSDPMARIPERENFYAAISQEFLSKIVPSEEIPEIIRGIDSGNILVRDAAMASALGMIGYHRADTAQNANRLVPPFLEVLDEFRAMIPTVTRHFGDTISDGRNPNILSDWTWKLVSVRFMDSVWVVPPPEMVSWMLEMVSDDSNEIVEILTHLDPLPSEVMHALMRRSDAVKSDRDRGISLAITFVQSLTDLKILGRGKTQIQADRTFNPELIEWLVQTALDKDAPSLVRIRAIMAVAQLAPSLLPRLQELANSDIEEVVHTANDVGLRKQ